MPWREQFGKCVILQHQFAKIELILKHACFLFLVCKELVIIIYILVLLHRAVDICTLLDFSG